MKKLFCFFWVCAYVLLIPNSVFSQRKDSIDIASIKGIVWDTVNNYPLQSATLAVYVDKDSSLLNYSLSNSLGEFSFSNLPCDEVIRVVATYVNYAAVVKKFSIPKSRPQQFLRVNMFRDGIALQEVVITSIPPVRMNGDTLEINAGAFRLNEEAVVEDLLRRIPNVTLWGDGKITVNGREVKQVYVEGKPFFGGDPAMAIQNLPVDVVKKIQVYRDKNQTSDNPFDSSTTMNIRLKPGRETGLFGKICAGYGSDKRYAFDGAFNYYNSKNQFSIAGAINNINKKVDNIATVLKSASFKGIGASLDYQTDFNAKGYSQQGGIGINYLHDFRNKVNKDRKKELNIEYFFGHVRFEKLRKSSTVSILDQDEFLTDSKDEGSKTSLFSHSFKAEYTADSVGRHFNVKAKAGLSDGTNSTSYEQQTEISGIGPGNTYLNKDNGNFRSRYVSAGMSYKNDALIGLIRKMHNLPAYNIDYSIKYSDDESMRSRKTKYVSMKNQDENRTFERKYGGSSKILSNSIDVGLLNISDLLLRNVNLGGVQIGVSNKLYLDNNTYADVVKNLDTVSKLYVVDTTLTNRRSLQIVNVMPAIGINKTFTNALYQRYRKQVTISFLAQGQYYFQEHASDKVFQRFKQSYSNFIPVISTSYNNEVYGRFSSNYTLSYSRSVGYPTVDDIAPLFDSANSLYLQKGNVSVKPEFTSDFKAGYSYRNERKNFFYGGAGFFYSNTSNSIADSTFYNPSGVATIYKVNLDKEIYLGGNGTLEKAVKYKSSTLQIVYRVGYSIRRSPNYYNSQLNLSKSRFLSHNFDITYRYKDVVALTTVAEVTFMRSAQSISESRYSGISSKLRMGGSVNFLGRLNVSSNIDYNRMHFDHADPVNFVILNAHLTGRFLNGKKGELKFSALDILRQNRSIITIQNRNGYTVGTENVLQQYYMVTFSYFPRKF